MTDEKEKFDEGKFLSRWSRLKQQASEQPAAMSQAGPPAIDPRAPPPELPPVDKLTIESDFRGFFHPKVDENLRRSALKKLFSDPHFNVMDGLDVYIDDYSQPNPLPAEMLAGLRQAQKILEWAKETPEETAAKRAELSAEKVALPPADQAASPAVAAEQPQVDHAPDAEQRPVSPVAAARKS